MNFSKLEVNRSLNFPKLDVNRSLNLSKLDEDTFYIEKLEQSKNQSASYKLQQYLQNQKSSQFQNFQQCDITKKEQMKYYKQNLNDINKFKKTVKLINKNEKKNSQLLTKNKQNDLTDIKQFQNKLLINIWKPMTRQTTSMCYYQDLIYMYSGIGDKYFQDLNVYDIEKNTWTQISEKCNDQLGRYGHSMYGYQQKLFIFGGKINHPLNQLSTNVLIYDLKTLNWKTIPSDQSEFVPRYNHQSCLIGKSMLILGGQCKKGDILSDLWLFGLTNYTWTKIKFNLQVINNTMTPVFDAIRNLENSLFDKKVKEDIQSPIKYEGIYLFQQKLQVIQIFENFKIIQPQTFGQNPKPRINHTATLNYDFNFYCICGGQNNNILLSDFHVLNLENMNWMKIDVKGYELQPIFQHNTIYYAGFIYIFGGLNFESYHNFEPIVLQQGQQIIYQNYILIQQDSNLIL